MAEGAVGIYLFYSLARPKNDDYFALFLTVPVRKRHHDPIRMYFVY